MSLTGAEPGDVDSRFSQAVAEYLEAAETGQPPNHVEWLARYPDLSSELEAFLDDQEAITRLVPPLRKRAFIPALGTSLTGNTSHASELITTSTVASMQTFGDYDILEEIGCGGMGVVYRARQRSLNRFVALKMIRAGLFATAEEKRRFQEEAETAASLEHPHIVPIYEVGELEGHPYFTMKLFPGGSLGQPGDGSSFSLPNRSEQRQIAEKMAVIARAVHHAHQHAVLHCDLKPANVLLDDRGQPVVTDFGLARRQPGSIAANDLSQVSCIAPGTPAYMAPEQAAGERKKIEVATDVYGLGGVLYHLLTGCAPFQADGISQLAEQIKYAPPDAPCKVNQQLDRDLNTICLKCLNKEQEDRYRSAEALAEDLERWLVGEPILARSVGRKERLVRWCRRNPARAIAVAMALLAVGVLAGSSVVVWKQGNVALEQRDTAVRERQRADRNALAAREAVDQMLTRVGNDLLYNVPGVELIRRQLLEDALGFYERFLLEEGNEPEVRQGKGRAHLRVANVLYNLGRHEDAMEHCRLAQSLFEALVAEYPDSAEYLQDLAQSYENHLLWRTRPKEAEGWYRRALKIRQQLVDQSPSDPERDHQLAFDYHRLARVLALSDKKQQVEAALQAIRIEENVVAASGLPSYKSALAEFLKELFRAYFESKPKRLAEAEAALRRALTIRKELEGQVPELAYRSAQAEDHYYLANMLQGDGRLAQAVQAFQDSLAAYGKLAAQFPDRLQWLAWQSMVQNQLADLLALCGPFDEAEQAYLTALQLYEKLLQPSDGHWRRMSQINSLAAMSVLGDRYASRGRLADARQMYERLCMEAEKAVSESPDDPDFQCDLAIARQASAALLKTDGRVAEAERLLRQALVINEKLLQQQPNNSAYGETRADTLADLATVQWLLGRPEEAENHARLAILVLDKLAGENYTNAASPRKLAWLLATFPAQSFRAPARAVALAKRAASLAPGNEDAWQTLGVAHYGAGDYASAVEVLKKSADLRGGGNGVDWFYLAMAQGHLRDMVQARTSFERAVQWLNNNRPKDPELKFLREEAATVLKKMNRP